MKEILSIFSTGERLVGRPLSGRRQRDRTGLPIERWTVPSWKKLIEVLPPRIRIQTDRRRRSLIGIGHSVEEGSERRRLLPVVTACCRYHKSPVVEADCYLLSEPRLARAAFPAEQDEAPAPLLDGVRRQQDPVELILPAKDRPIRQRS